jgi:mRNA interferase MazF
MIAYPKRGEIWLSDFNPAVGGEIRKIRPAVIISNNHSNRNGSTITILPVTDKGRDVYPFEVCLPEDTEGLSKDSKVKCQQIRTVDKSRVIKLLGQVDNVQLLAIEEALKLHLDFK